MPGCVLRISGDEFDLDALLASIDVSPCHVQRKGAPRFESGRSIAEYTGFNIDVSKDDGNDLAHQVRDATQFLATSRTAIQRAVNYPGVEHAELDFCVNCRLGNGVAVQNNSLSSDLLKLAGDLGVDVNVSIYSSPNGANSGDDSDTVDPPTTAIGPRFGIKDLLALTTIVAFVSSAISLMLNVGLPFFAIVPLIVPWAVGTYIGISKMARRQQSTLVGGLVGGGLGALLLPGLPTFFFFTPGSMMIRIGYAAWGVGIGMCCGGILAGIVGVVGGRLSVRRRTSID